MRRRARTGNVASRRTGCAPPSPRRCAPVALSAGVRPYVAPVELVVDLLAVGLDHDAGELVPVGLGLPAEDLLRLGRIAEQVVDLGRPVVVGVDLDVRLPVEVDRLERRGDELLDCRPYA